MHNPIAGSNPLPSYRQQTPDVRARLDRMKARELILEVRNLTKIFQGGARTTTALDNINFSTHRREFLCVVGPSGCGKSTLIRILAGLERKPTAKFCCKAIRSSARQGPRHGVSRLHAVPWLTRQAERDVRTRDQRLERYEAERQALQWLQLVGLEKFAERIRTNSPGG